MKRARIAYNGAIHDVTVEDGLVVLADGRRLAEDKVAPLRAAGYLRKPLNLGQLREAAERHCGPPRR